MVVPARQERAWKTLAVSDERLISSTPAAPWLPDGSTAEAWSGRDCAVPDPCIIVRLLLVRQAVGGPEFFCVPTYRGLDLPSLPLASGSTRMTTAEGIALLASTALGRTDVEHRCAGYIRNVVPHPDAGYPHPAHHLSIWAPR